MPRLLVVSNRLPLTVTKQGDEWKYKMSSGGLVTALNGLKKEMTFTWIGWPGFECSPEDQKIIKSDLQKLMCVPIFIDNTTADAHYNGFSNR
jgi:trehalose-6-phosphate synthase